MCFYTSLWASQVALEVKNPPSNAGDIRDVGLIPGLGRSPGGGHGNPLQCSCLENPLDRGAWRAAIHRAAKSRTRLKCLSKAQHSDPGQVIGGARNGLWSEDRKLRKLEKQRVTRAHLSKTAETPGRKGCNFCRPLSSSPRKLQPKTAQCLEGQQASGLEVTVGAALHGADRLTQRSAQGFPGGPTVRL